MYCHIINPLYYIAFYSINYNIYVTVKTVTVYFMFSNKHN